MPGSENLTVCPKEAIRFSLLGEINIKKYKVAIKTKLFSQISTTWYGNF